nr:MAG TPA: hypothetical protein [Caudoviricetes sp.]
MAVSLLTMYSNHNYNLRKFTSKWPINHYIKNFISYIKHYVKTNKYISFTHKFTNGKTVNISFSISNVKLNYYHWK